MEHKIKVLFFLPGSVGGAERITITIAKILPRDRFYVKFIIIGSQPRDIVDFIPKDFDIEFLNIRSIWAFSILRIASILRKEGADYAFCSLRYINYRLLIASRLCGSQKCIVRNDNGLDTLRPYEIPLVKYTYKWAYKIVAQQEEMRQELIFRLGLSPKSVLAIQNPIDSDTIDKMVNVDSPFNKDDKTIIKVVSVGRFDYTKGQDVLVKAFSIFHDRFPQSKLYYVGKINRTSQYFIDIESEIQKRGLTDSVVFVGYDSNPYRWMKNANCFVLPSRVEGLPNSLAEAMYLGCPVVATRSIPVIERMVSEGVNGFTVPVEDYELMAMSMERAIALKKCSMSYQPASRLDIINLFS